MRQGAARGLFWVAAVGTVTSTIYSAMVAVAAVRFGRRKRREDQVAAGYLPPVSVLKPLHGAEPGLEESLRRFFLQEYPEYEVIFCARQESDAGLRLARRVAAEYPGVPARFVACGEPQFPNAKMWSLAALSEAARYETLVTSDADARVAPDYLRRCVQVLADGQTELASCLYVGRTEGGFWAQLDAVGKSVEMTGGILVAEMVERGTRFAIGVTMILRRRAFAEAGGYEELGQFYAEDFVLGNRLAERGHGVRVANHVIRLMVLAAGAARVVQRSAATVDEEHCGQTLSRPGGPFLGSGLTFAVRRLARWDWCGRFVAGARGRQVCCGELGTCVDRWLMAATVLWALEVEELAGVGSKVYGESQVARHMVGMDGFCWVVV